MKRILIAVDGKKSSKAVLSTFQNMVRQPEEIVLLHVEKLEGRSLMIDMLGDAELKTLKEAITGTEHKEILDRNAEQIVSFYKKEFEESGVAHVRTIIKEGHPAQEILKTAEQENVDLILLGYSDRKGLNRIIAGSVAKEVQKAARIPVLTARRPMMCEEPYSWKDAYTAATVTTAIVIGMFLVGVLLQRGTLH